MLIVMDARATPEQVEHVCSVVELLGFSSRPMPGGFNPSQVHSAQDGFLWQHPKLSTS